MNRRHLPAFLLSLAVLTGWPLRDGVCFAHGAGYRVLDGASPLALELSYSSGDPMAYAQVTVRGPLDDEVEFQNGRTDRNGRFAFVPDEAGQWKVVVEDGLGHRVSALCPVEASGSERGPAPSPARKSPPASKGLAALLGVSLIANATLIAMVIGKRKRT